MTSALKPESSPPRFLPAAVVPKISPALAGGGGLGCDGHLGRRFGPGAHDRVPSRPVPTRRGRIRGVDPHIEHATRPLSRRQWPGADGHEPWAGDGPGVGRDRPLATFNLGFCEADAAAGVYVYGTSYFAMTRGFADVRRDVCDRPDAGQHRLSDPDPPSVRVSTVRAGSPRRQMELPDGRRTRLGRSHRRTRRTAHGRGCRSGPRCASASNRWR